jgi:glycerophosphoryl diester phosphodiesterase
MRARVWVGAIAWWCMSAAHAGEPPIVIGHRGASGYVPEHTLTSYFIAVQQGADYVEPDLVMTKDGVLVARHENEIGGTTDVARHAGFADRRKRKVIDGAAVEGWFTEDFTLAELKQLRARERIPELRPGNVRFDGQFEVPTFDEVLALVRALDAQRAATAKSRGKPAPARIGVYPETKHPSYFAGLGLPMEKAVVEALHRAGFRRPRDPAFIQSFEVGNLRELRRLTRLRLIQLIAAEGAPYDFVARGERRTYADLVTPAGLKEIASYADGIGVQKDLVVPRTADGLLGAATALVRDAHAARLLVHVWTLRAENQFLPAALRAGPAPHGTGDMQAEASAFLAAGVDGFFTDHPMLGARAREAFVKAR